MRKFVFLFVFLSVSICDLAQAEYYRQNGTKRTVQQNIPVYKQVYQIDNAQYP